MITDDKYYFWKGSTFFVLFSFDLTQVIYITIVAVMGVTCVIVSLWDKFGSPRLRPFRAGIFITFGLSGIAPATHYSIQNGWEKSINEAALGWLVFMGFLYISGAMLYAFRSSWVN